MSHSKSKGTTPSERYLASLCEKTFLSLWSYPNVYRDQAWNQGKGAGKELCDLLVKCGEDVIIFSDKSYSFGNSGNLNTDWCRWFKKAIKKSADQIYGAERWIKTHPDRLFLDSQCTSRFPLGLESAEKLRIHRVVVAVGAKERCKKELGGSGSLIICPGIVGNAHCDQSSQQFEPFHVGLVDPNRGFVHVLDDVSLDIVLRELDTVTDFVRYLRKKEAFIESGKLHLASGEEDLLAVYLRDRNDEGEHDWRLPAECDQLVVQEGAWHNLQHHAQFLAKKYENETSYLWDSIIEDFNKHTFHNTLVYGSDRPVSETEIALRILAMEDRHQRRIFSQAMIDMINRIPPGQIGSRSFIRSGNSETAYVFQFVPQKIQDEHEYRDFRRTYLGDYCFVFAWKHRDFKQVVGISTESRPDVRRRSYDLAVIEPGEWTQEMEEDAKSIQNTWGFLRDNKIHLSRFDSDEYPEVQQIKVSPPPQYDPAQSVMPRRLKIGRNDPCSCGSGLKYKKCCGKSA